MAGWIFYGDTALDTVLQVQEISQKSPYIQNVHSLIVEKSYYSRSSHLHATTDTIHYSSNFKFIYIYIPGANKNPSCSLTSPS